MKESSGAMDRRPNVPQSEHQGGSVSTWMKAEREKRSGRIRAHSQLHYDGPLSVIFPSDRSDPFLSGARTEPGW